MTTTQTLETNDIYDYQKRFIFAETSVLSLLLAILLISWFPNIFSYVMFGVIIPNAMKAATYLSVTLFSIVILLSFIRKELKNSKIILTDELIVKRKPYKLAQVQFAEITGIGIKKLPFISFLIIDAKHRLAIPFLIEDMSGLIEKIQVHLIENGKFNFNGTEINRIKSDATVHDILYKTSLKAYPFVLRAMLLSCLAGIVIAFEFWEMAYLPIILWGIMSLFFPPFTFGLASLFIKQKVKKSLSDNINGSKPDFSSEFYAASLIAFVIYLTFGILFKTLYPW